MTSFPRQYAAIISRRPAHELNDALVTLRPGARAESMFAGGAGVTGVPALRGYVWYVQGDRAVVDFGATSSGVPLRVAASLSDIELA